MDRKKARQLIDEKGYKHKWVAAQIGVTPGSLSRFLTGKTTLNGSAQILLSQVLGDADQPKRTG